MHFSGVRLWDLAFSHTVLLAEQEPLPLGRITRDSQDAAAATDVDGIMNR